MIQMAKNEDDNTEAIFCEILISASKLTNPTDRLRFIEQKIEEPGNVSGNSEARHELLRNLRGEKKFYSEILRRHSRLAFAGFFAG